MVFQCIIVVSKTVKQSVILRRTSSRSLSFISNLRPFMESSKSITAEATDIFTTAIDSVIPKNMVQSTLKLNGNKLRVGSQEYDVNKNIHILAMGKAAGGMVRSAEYVLGDHLVDGICSIPFGIQDIFTKAGKKDILLPSVSSRVKLIEGANNNIPDAGALQAATEIYTLAKSLTENDFALTLITGGGSALLPLPKSPITLEEMAVLTRLMGRNGATIQQLNCLRRNIEVLKGGGLAKAIYPAKGATLILSDVIGNGLHDIASGPTAVNPTPAQDAVNILKDLGIIDKVPASVVKVLESENKDVFHCENIYNSIVGSNEIALQAAFQKAESLGYHTVILSTMIEGEAKKVGCMIAELAKYVCGVKLGNVPKIEAKSTGPLDFPPVAKMMADAGVSEKKIQMMMFETSASACTPRPFCVLLGGETTVQVKGSGKGGRNQEMALAAAIAMKKPEFLHIREKFDVQFLSGGTDGQDGPTEAAGAIAHPDLATHAYEQGLDPQTFIEDNDAFNFFSQMDNGKWLVKTGLTGTNVMDIQVLLIKPK